MLFMAESGRFASCAAGHQTLRAFRNLPFHEVAKRGLVKGAILERRDQGDKRASKHWNSPFPGPQSELRQHSRMSLLPQDDSARGPFEICDEGKTYLWLAR
jgi:hypothetical protein